MKYNKYILSLFYLLLFSIQLNAQEEEDSIPVKSFSASVGLSYTNHYSYAGRDFAVTQSSFSPSIYLSHKSGFYSSFSGSWVDNTYASSNLGLGFRYDILSWLAASTGYSKSFIPTEEGENPLSNSFDAGISFSSQYLSLGSSYSYLLGAETGQTVSLSMSTGVSKDFDWFINSISFNPSFSILLGTDNAVFRKITIKQYKKGIGKNIKRDVPKNLSGKKGSTLPPVQQTVAGGTVITPITITENPFGVLTYDLSFPISLSISNLSLSAAYNLSIPNQLSIYDGKLSNIHYVTFGASYSF